jgi:hypothetical protein
MCSPMSTGTGILAIKIQLFKTNFKNATAVSLDIWKKQENAFFVLSPQKESRACAHNAQKLLLSFSALFAKLSTFENITYTFQAEAQ